VKRTIPSFRGEAPRLARELLPDNAASEAINCNLLTGNLKAFKQFSTTIGLANSGVVQTIFLLNDAWLSWEADVDVARGAIAGDTTFRTYLTAPLFYGEPRFTDYAMATTGSPPYPVTTRPLGVPGPDTPPTASVGVGSTPTVDVTDSGDQFATSWTPSPTVIVGATISYVEQDAALGNPLPSYAVHDKNNYPGSIAYMYRDFGLADCTAVTYASDFYCESSQAGKTQAAWRVMCSGAGSGCIVKVGYPVGLGQLYLMIGTSDAWSPGSHSWLTQVPISDLSQTTWYRMVIAVTRNQSGTLTITATIYSGVTELATAAATSSFFIGSFCGIEGSSTGGDEWEAHYDNFVVQGSGTTSVPTTTATSYVFTYVNDLGEESAPSLPSSTVLRPDGVTVTVTTPTTLPSNVSSDYGIATKRIYRAATGNAGTVFRFLAEIPLATANYDDTLTDDELGEVLPSEVWALPPDDLEGILTLPNGVMAGFAKNQLCLSAQNYPHAWPVEWRLNTDTDIIGIGNIDTTVVIGTESFVYVASGNDPAAYSMSKSEVQYACVSKRSFAYLTGIGVVFAGPDGLMAVTGPTSVRNLTDSVFTREQWQALNPSSIRAEAHNDIYWMHWESGSARGCYAIDMKATGFGVVQMAFHASAIYVDPIEDKMYLVLDGDDEPDDDLLPVRADPPRYIDGMTIFEFEGNQSVLMTFRYRSKLWLLENPAWMMMAQMKAADFDNIVLRLYGDGVQVDELVVADQTEFTLAEADEYESLEFELVGTSTVRTVQACEDVAELS
jgi:hypothetical protein